MGSLSVEGEARLWVRVHGDGGEQQSTEMHFQREALTDREQVH
jgi:hypothetical protein